MINDIICLVLKYLVPSYYKTRVIKLIYIRMLNNNKYKN